MGEGVVLIDLDEAIDGDGLTYIAARLSNGVELQIYANGVGISGTDAFIGYEDLVRLITQEVTFIPEVLPRAEA